MVSVITSTTRFSSSYSVGVSFALHALFVVGLLSLAMPPKNIVLPPQAIPVSLVMTAPPAPAVAAPPAPNVTPSIQQQPEQPKPIVKPLQKKPVRNNPVKASPSPAAVTKPVTRSVAPSTQQPVSYASTRPVQTTPSPTRTATAPIFDAAYLRNPAPEYPAIAKRRGMEGRVLLKVLVTSDGNADTVQVLNSSGYGILDAAATRAVEAWKFIPAKLGDETVMAEVVVPMEFRLD